MNAEIIKDKNMGIAYLDFHNGNIGIAGNSATQNLFDNSVNENQCKYLIRDCIYDGEIEEICGYYLKMSEQEQSPHYSRSKIFCMGKEKCPYKDLMDQLSL
jgi:hypothetical protein